MIWTLVREQARYDLRFAGWVVAMLGAVVAFVTLASSQLESSNQASEQAGRWLGFSHDTATLYWASTIGSREIVDNISEVEIDAMLDAASAEADDLVATRNAFPFNAATNSTVFVGAARGDHVLAERGVEDLPGPGEAIVDAGYAREAGLNVGDSLTLVGLYFDWSEHPYPGKFFRRTNGDATHTFTVVGTMSTTSVRVHDVLVAWDDSFGPNSIFTVSYETGSANTSVLQTAPVQVSWSGNAPSLVSTIEGGLFYFDHFGPPQASIAGWMAAFAMAVVAIIVSFATGRSQAQRRLRWEATARTLGADAGMLRAVAGIQAVGIAVAAFVLGAGVGIGSSAMAVAADNALRPSGVAPFATGLDPIVLAWTGIATVFLSVAVSAVPVYWAARRAPAAALKPVSDVTEATVSRHVSVLWVAIPFALALGVPAVTAAWQTDLRDAANGVAIIVIAISGYALALELFRTLAPLAARVLERGKRPWQYSAAIGLRARPRQYAMPAFITFLAVVAATIWGASSWTGNFYAFAVRGGDFAEFGSQPFDGAGYAPSWTILLTGLAALIAQLASLTILANNARTSAADLEAQRALGLTRADAVRSAFAQHVILHLSAVLIGTAAAIALGISHPLERPSGTHVSPDSAPHLPDTLAAIGLVGLVAAAFAIIGALAFAAVVARQHSPDKDPTVRTASSLA